jgi:hypothetical protein
MERLGYQRCEPVWEIIRGSKWKEVITDVRISVDGKALWVKTGDSAAKGEG